MCMTYVLSHFGSGVLHLHCVHSYGHQFHCCGNPQVGSPCQCKLDCQDKWDHCLGQRFQQYSEGLVHLEMEKWEAYLLHGYVQISCLGVIQDSLNGGGGRGVTCVIFNRVGGGLMGK